MKRDRMFVNGLMRLAACALMVSLGVGNVWGESILINRFRPANPEFIKWQKRQDIYDDTVANKSRRQIRRLALKTSESGGDALTVSEGLIPTMIDFSYLNDLNDMNVYGISDPLPSRYDPRDSFKMTPVRHQDPQNTGIGTCWAQASIGSMEIWLTENGYGQNQLSVKNLVNLTGWDRGANPQKPSGWFGGNYLMSASYLLRWNGPVGEAADPYTNENGTLNYSLNSPKLSPVYHVQQMRLVPARQGALDNNALKHAILKFGGLYSSILLYSDSYWGKKGAYYCNEKGACHAVTLVGWDDNYSRDNFAQDCRPPGDGAFIVKDSYGVDSPRDGGYIYVSYYDSTFAYTTSCAFPMLEDVGNYATIYQYDQLGLVNSFVDASSAYAANIFTATEAGMISAIGFYAIAPNESYTITIYTDCSANAPTSGTKGISQSGVIGEYAGYYTLKLDKDVEISKGQRFSVVVKLTTVAKHPIPVEFMVDGYTSGATASPGESFLSLDGVKWFDFTEVIHATANFCCKAYTKSKTAAQPKLSSIVIEGVASMVTGGSKQFKCKAVYDNNSSRDVTLACSWSLTDGREYASVTPSGLVTAKNVTEQKQVTVKASYTEDGITKEDTWGFYVTVAAPDAPTGVDATKGTETSCVRVNWTASSGSTEFAVYRATENNSANARHIGSVTVPRYNDTEATPGVDYWYFIKAKNASDGASGYSVSANGWRKLSQPTIGASQDLTDRIDVRIIEGAEGAKAYRIYRTEDIVKGEKTPIGGWVSPKTFPAVYSDKNAEAGKSYYYGVLSAVDTNGNRPSDFETFSRGVRIAPVTMSELVVSGAASIPSGGSATYEATVKYSNGKAKYVSPNWILAPGGTYASVDTTGKVTAKTVTANQAITLKASYSEDGKTVSGTKEITITASKTAAPTGLKVTTKNESSIGLGWSAMAGASSYRVYRSTSGKAASEIGECSGTTYTDKTVTPGVSYSYSVTAVNSAGESAKSAAVTVSIPIAAPTGVIATSDRTDGVAVFWQPSAGATHYRVSRATSATGSKTELGAWRTDKTYTDTSAESGKVYWYFVRAATNASGANASEYSAPPVQGSRVGAEKLSSISIIGADEVLSGNSALYSCVASYGGKSKPVTPAWSVSPATAAALSRDGRLTAKAVSANAEVTVSATFTDGDVTKTASKKVKILAPATATAEIKDVTTTTRWPFAAILDIDYTLAVNPASAKAVIGVFGRDEDHGVDVAAASLSGDGADGSCISAGKHRLTWDIGADYPDFHAKAFSVTLTATPSFTVTPDSLTISGPSSVTAGGTATYTCAVSRNDGTSDEVSPSWSVTSGDSYASISSSGVLTAKGISTRQSVTIKASYTQNGATKTATKTVAINTKAITITFNPNGGTVSPTTKSYTAYGTYGSLPAATYTGHTFAGWWTAANGGTQVTASSTVSASVTTLYAHWETLPVPTSLSIAGPDHVDAGGVATYTCSVSRSDGTGGAVTPAWSIASGEAYATIDQSGVLSANGISTQQSVTIKASYTQNGATKTATKTVTINTKAVTITFNPNGGTVSPTSKSYVANGTYGVLPTATYDGHKFAGWWTAASGGTQITESSIVPMTVITLYAHWIRVYNLMPLRNLLTNIEQLTPDGVLSDDELNKAMSNPHYTDMDGDSTTISSEEMSIFRRIQALNTDKTLISDVIKGDYSGIPESTMEELQSLSDAIKNLTQNR